MKFYTNDSEYSFFNGVEIVNIKTLSEDEYDKEDVGQMYRITVLIGESIHELDAFEDEIKQEFKNGN